MLRVLEDTVTSPDLDNAPAVHHRYTMANAFNPPVPKSSRHLRAWVRASRFFNSSKDALRSEAA
jgi:hypothetical protein